MTSTIILKKSTHEEKAEALLKELENGCVVETDCLEVLDHILGRLHDRGNLDGEVQAGAKKIPLELAVRMRFDRGLDIRPL